MAASHNGCRKTWCLSIVAVLALVVAMLVAVVPNMYGTVVGVRRLLQILFDKDGPLFRDLVEYEATHRALYAGAVADGDYSNVTVHYYSLQAKLLEIGVGHYWHWMPEDPKLSVEENFEDLNAHFAEYLALKPNETLCEIGCGLCRTGRDVAQRMGARFIGVTMSPNEVEIGTAELNRLGQSAWAKIIQGDYTQMPVADGYCDGVLAVYTLKYSEPGAKLNKAFTEISRVLKPGRRFVSYDIITTESYDDTNSTHAGWSYNISYHCGMPPLASVRHYREDAPTVGLKLVAEYDMGQREGTISAEKSYPFRLRPDLVAKVLMPLDSLGIKKGLGNWLFNFVLHPSKDFIDSMAAGVVTSSTIFAYERAAL